MTDRRVADELLASPRLTLGVRPARAGGYDLILLRTHAGNSMAHERLIAGPIHLEQTESILSLSEAHLLVKLAELQENAG